MIIYARVENYRSIGEKQELNLIPSTDKSHLEMIIDSESDGVLPVIPIYGGNATGKTNILKFLKVLSDIVSGKTELQEAYDPCKFYDKEDTIFEIIFLKNTIKYYYKIVYKSKEILEEVLYYYPNGKISKIFDRKDKNYSFGSNFESNLKFYSNDTPVDISFLNFISKFLKGKIKVIDDAGNFFKEDLIFIGFSKSEENLYEAKKLFKENENKKNAQVFIDYFYKHLNIGAKGIRFSSINEGTKNEILKKILSNKELRDKLSKDLSEEQGRINSDLESELLKSFLFQGKESLDLVYEINNKEILIPIEEESTGVQKIFTLGSYIADALCNNKVVIFDELEIGFHPIIAKKIIELFLDRNTQSQLIFTTHNTNLLDLNLFRRDQIYFTSRTEETGYKSVFKSLGSISGVRKSADIEKAYLEGRYCDSPTYESFDNEELIGGLLCLRKNV